MALRRDLGALATVSVVPVSGRELTPRTPFPAICGATAFGVRRGQPGCHTELTPICDSTAVAASGGTGLGRHFGGNRLSPSLIGLSPLPRALGIGLSPRTPSGPPLGIRRASPWPGVDRWDSGAVPVTPRPFRRRPSPRVWLRACRFRCASSRGFRLATGTDSSARVSKRTVRP